MQTDSEILKLVYQNAEIGTNTISYLSKIVENEEFKNELNKEYIQYKAICNDSEHILSSNGEKATGINFFQKLSTSLALRINLMSDKSISHMAEMLVEGNTMGTIDMIRNIRNYPNITNETQKIAKKLLTYEENNIMTMKGYI